LISLRSRHQNFLKPTITQNNQGKKPILSDLGIIFCSATNLMNMSAKTTTSSDQAAGLTPTVAECMMEFLLGEMLHWVEQECDPSNLASQRSKVDYANNIDSGKKGSPGTALQDGSSGAKGEANNDAARSQNEEERCILSAELAAAKMERLGFGVGYRLCERLAQTKPLGTPNTPGGAGAVTPGGDSTAAMQLEAVKFLCKEFWTEVFRKQIDKLQTNHRGVFVLKDHELRWLRRLPSDDERARVAAIKLLAFPCGLIRGALNNLGIAAVVSCDFLTDGKSMAACSFNIKIKS
jgi:hypothetical protein